MIERIMHRRKEGRKEGAGYADISTRMCVDGFLKFDATSSSRAGLKVP